MRRNVWLTCVCWLVAGAAAFAQPQPPQPPPGPPRQDLGRWWKDSEIVRTLGLSEAQTKKIEEVFFDHRMKLIDLHADLERQETLLQPLMDAAQPDEAKVSTQIDLVLAARGRLEKANTMMMLAIRRVLTVDQWHKLEQIREQREREWGPQGPPRPDGHAGPHPPQGDGPGAGPRPPQGPPPPGGPGGRPPQHRPSPPDVP